MGNRTAIYVPFPQAVPARPVIDRSACLHFLKGKCGLCAKKCQAGAIRFDDEDQLVTEEVGAIVVATGFQLYNIGKQQSDGRTTGYGEYGYGREPRRDRLAAVRAAGFGLGADQRRDSTAVRRQSAEDGGVHQLRRLARQRQGHLLLLENLLHVHRQAHHALQAQGA